VQAARDLADFWRAPIGRYVVERAFLQFCAVEDLWGYVIWGDLTEPDVRAIATSVFHDGWNDAPAHRSFIDLRRVTAIDATGFTMLRTAQAEHREQLARRVTQMAIVRPDGFIGAIAEGIANVVSFPHPVEVFATAEEALARLGVAPALLAELDAAGASVAPSTRVVAELHTVFDTQPPDVTLPAVAKLLGLSPRNLQRKLRDLGTTFLAERNLAQVRLAQRLIAQTDATLSQIALDVGCRSLQHFSTMFRRVTGQAPSQWRTAQRR
jgi:AraC-like DNA-binding protein